MLIQNCLHYKYTRFKSDLKREPGKIKRFRPSKPEQFVESQKDFSDIATDIVNLSYINCVSESRNKISLVDKV